MPSSSFLSNTYISWRISILSYKNLGICMQFLCIVNEKRISSTQIRVSFPKFSVVDDLKSIVYELPDFHFFIDDNVDIVYENKSRRRCFILRLQVLNFVDDNRNRRWKTGLAVD